MDSKLYLALVKDDTDVLKEKGRSEDVRDQRTPANNTALHLACQHGSIGCVNEILTTHESLLFQTNLRGETALHLAARQGHYDVVEALIKKAKSSNEEPNNLQNTSSTVLQNLIRASNVEFETALHVAVRYNHEKVVELLVKEDSSYSYPRNKYDETPLYLAVIRCYAGVTKVILDNCDLPTYGGPHGRTALHAALMDARGYECMILLLEKNKDLIKVADNNGWTAFHYVAHNNLENLVGKVVEFLMNVNKFVAYLADKKYKRTALHVAACKGNVGVMMEFMKYVPDGWESVDGNGQNIFHIAVREDQKSMIDYIWSQNMKRNLLIQRDNDGNTPFHLIAKFKCYFPGIYHTWNVDCEDILVVVNNKNFTPLDVLHQKQTAGTQSPEALIGGVRRHWDDWITKIEEEKSPYQKIDYERFIKRYREMANTQMIVAALITTVALTAGFAMPGGFDSNQGPNQGSPVLIRKTAFKIFMVADTIALLCSISSLFLYSLTSFDITRSSAFYSLLAATVSNVISITAMMVAFIAGTSAVLSHSSALTITVSIISSLFPFLLFFVGFRYFFKFLRYMYVVYLTRYLVSR